MLVLEAVQLLSANRDTYRIILQEKEDGREGARGVREHTHFTNAANTQMGERVSAYDISKCRRNSQQIRT